MSLKPVELVEFGGVDSRSNPANMPHNRALRCLNWVPKQDGHLELRYGYSTEAMSAPAGAAIHSLFSYQNWAATKKYLVVAQANGLSIHDLSTHLDTTPTIRGAAIASSANWGAYFADNRLHIGNGTDQKFYDGSVFRDNGLRAPTAAEFANVVLADGTRELTAAENSTITVTQSAGGSFTATDPQLPGLAFCVALFNAGLQELGPATLVAGSVRLQITGSGKKVTVANMPTGAPVAAYVKLIARTGDGLSDAYFCTTTSTAITSCTRSGTTLTVISPAHGLSSGQIVILAGTTNFDAVYQIVVVDVNTFTIALNQASGNNVSGANTTGGTVKMIVGADASTASVDVTSTATDTSFIVNQSRGVAASSVGGPNPGYLFYGAIYNPVTGHVGNRLMLASYRYVPSVRRNVRILGLPDYSGTDAEWGIMIGRTGDGAAVPYVIDDNSGNFIAAASGQTSITISAAQLDTRELPTRNGIIPAECTMFAKAADFIYAADPNSPTVRRSGSQLDDDSETFLGRPEQSWAANDITTFPTAEAVTGIAEDDQELFAGTLNDCAVLADENGQPMWKGPWNVGLAGPRAMVKAKPYGFFWLSSTRQLCTFVSGMPAPVSDEYEAAELSQIGDTYLAATELVYYRDATIGKDEIRIEGRKSDGTPITIIHDFKLRDERSVFGQGYSAQFGATLATAFTSVMARDANGRPRIFVGSSTGQLFQLYSGADDIGTQYDADTVYLVNVGTLRPDMPFIEWIGDGNTVVSIGKTLSTALDLGSEFAFEVLNPQTGLPQSVQGAEDDSHWRVDISASQLQTHLYVRFQLTSHSADGSLALNAPPHIPLETYGRIYELMPIQGAARGK